ncbi:MAG: NrtA/SsuA/CpmA family ABC transporter substrate-binding protein [Rhodospirillales bacterium]|nr:NrtA/SsuA/CpmA family ABC transporter substrate-binding protein [Rhodospirillales bacterium]
MKLHKTILPLFILSMALAPVLAAVNANAAEKIRIGSRLEYYDVNYREGGFDKKYGLDAEAVPFKTGIEVVSAIQSGEIDFASTGHVPLAVLMSKTDKVLTIATAGYNAGSAYRMVVPVNSTFKSIEDLKGKVIATKLGSGSYNAFVNYLKAKGLNEKEFKMKNGGPGAIVAAMQGGSVDAGIWFDPTISLILYKKWGRVLLDFDGHATFMGLWIVNRKFAEKNPDAVVRFLAGAMDSGDLLNSDPGKASQLLATGYQRRGRDYPAGVFKDGIPLIDFSSPIKQKYIDEIKKTYQFLKAKGRIKGNEPAWNTLITSKYLDQAKKIRK